ncbi:hypothetical protein PHAVU_008G030900 [Phaseolus vulgaris]|uniref:Uncharacterized protein n=1 Tax=Phaseolus vulgaris TaxID=3885 RepID=V7B0M6_PHAVU|nr:hypothetical protein PHAVU_008G030900g [Phaseolus vulgaris]ESW11447.1 hypothetical protein PHAVU_008G030900g [Phaseolus vulgaris]
MYSKLLRPSGVRGMVFIKAVEPVKWVVKIALVLRLPLIGLAVTLILILCNINRRGSRRPEQAIYFAPLLLQVFGRDCEDVYVCFSVFSLLK